MKVLLVDDSAIVRLVQRNMLGKWGITDILEAEDGQDGLNKLAENMPVDLVLLDLLMPIKDGWKFLAEAKADAAYEKVKIVVVTGAYDSDHSLKVLGLEILGAGADDYLVKPFLPDALKAKLENLGIIIK